MGAVGDGFDETRYFDQKDRLFMEAMAAERAKDKWKRGWRIALLVGAIVLIPSLLLAWMLWSIR